MITTSLSTTPKAHYEPCEVLILYRGGDRKFLATEHVVQKGSTGLRLGTGALVKAETLERWYEGLHGEQPLEFLPERVLAMAGHAMVWYAPEGMRSLYFHQRAKYSLPDLSGKLFPHPPLLFKVEGHSLSVRALYPNGSQRPLPSDPVFAAPYWNTYTDGAVCLGTSRLPKRRGVAAIPEWESSFFDSEFSHEVPGVERLTTHPDGFPGLWKEMEGKDEFPAQYLVKLRQTIAEFISS